MDFDTMIGLEPHGADTYVGVGPRYPWGGLYGGQIVAQALRAAAATVEVGFVVHSVHAYFIRRGDDTEPVRYEVHRLRNGRSFATRGVVARQSIGVILHVTASFQVAEDGPAVTAATMPRGLAEPESLPGDSWSPMFERRFLPRPEPGVARAWLAMTAPVPDDAVLPACALAYVSDDLPTDAVVTLHPERREAAGHDDEFPFWSASLDHAIWFHRPIPAEGWLLHEFRCDALISGRGVASGRVFDRDGSLLATVAQEVLLRRFRVR